MRRRSTLPFAAFLVVALGACGPAEVVVTMEIDVPNPDGEGMVTRALADIEVQLLPFDRDAIFDSMATAYGTPEPAIPEDLLAARDEVRAAQESWQAAEARWGAIRDTLQKISTTMEDYNPAEARYVALFREFNDFESQLSSVETARERAFAQFTQLQSGTIQASDSVRILQENWADEAFSGVGDVFLEHQRMSGLQAVADTTDASGIARERLRVSPGRYWVHARYELTYTELYWNFPIDVVRGEPLQVRLTRENAEERIKL